MWDTVARSLAHHLLCHRLLQCCCRLEALLGCLGREMALPAGQNSLACLCLKHEPGVACPCNSLSLHCLPHSCSELYCLKYNSFSGRFLMVRNNHHCGFLIRETSITSTKAVLSLECCLLHCVPFLDSLDSKVKVRLNYSFPFSQVIETTVLRNCIFRMQALFY